jgi:putative Ca2+/H+ antiporter (TMEM165/GDT1 family)
MEWGVFAATFGAVFLAELADTTQLVGMAMTAKSARPFTVYIGSVCAYAVVTVISVLAGAAFSRFLKPELIRALGAVSFISVGILMWLRG